MVQLWWALRGSDSTLIYFCCFDLFHFIFIHMILMTMIDNISILKMLSTRYCSFLDGCVAWRSCVTLLYVQIATPPYFSKRNKSSRKNKTRFCSHICTKSLVVASHFPNNLPPFDAGSLQSLGISYWFYGSCRGVAGENFVHPTKSGRERKCIVYPPEV